MNIFVHITSEFLAEMMVYMFIQYQSIRKYHTITYTQSAVRYPDSVATYAIPTPNTLALFEQGIQ